MPFTPSFEGAKDIEKESVKVPIWGKYEWGGGSAEFV